MNSEQHNDTAINAAREYEDMFPSLNRKLEARRRIDAEMERLKETGQLYMLSDEEIKVLNAFRRFKTRVRKAGEVFKWQTTPLDECRVILAEDSGLIVHPGEVHSDILG